MQLTEVESGRVLGVYVDSHPTWNEQTDPLHRKLLQRIAIFSKSSDIYGPNIDCFSTVQISNRSLLIAVLFGATVAKPT